MGPRAPVLTTRPASRFAPEGGAFCVYTLVNDGPPHGKRSSNVCTLLEVDPGSLKSLHSVLIMLLAAGGALLILVLINYV
ncbi:hypothetical protein Cs7R123_59620 [Catellatospora sp. TT07R-123]|nr:hypothetical protein Cs7R123_59620 [Catellatospora sp. TT07R-123]